MPYPIAHDTKGDAGGPRGARLLPWSSPEGNPCYLVGDGAGFLSGMADEAERVQLDMAAGLLGHAADMLADRKVTSAQLRYLASRLTEALHDTHRIALSRGQRTAGPDE